MATLKSDLSLHNLTFEDAIELALDKSLWRLLVASGATHWHGARRIMMMMMIDLTVRGYNINAIVTVTAKKSQHWRCYLYSLINVLLVSSDLISSKKAVSITGNPMADSVAFTKKSSAPQNLGTVFHCFQVLGITKYLTQTSVIIYHHHHHKS